MNDARFLQVHLDHHACQDYHCDVDSWSNSIIMFAKIVIVMTMKGLTQWKEPGNLLTIMMAGNDDDHENGDNNGGDGENDDGDCLNSESL